jgi:O-succinylbenzoic acid--CoA ligase
MKIINHFYLLTQEASSPSIISPNIILSFEQLKKQVDQQRQKLERVGVTSGQRVALIGPNSGDYLITILALWQMGIIIVPLNTHWPQTLIENGLKTIECDVLILMDDQPKIKAIPTIRFISSKALSNPDNSKAGEIPKETDIINPDQPANILFTSGSTGLPKAAVHSFANHYYNALGSQENIPLKNGDGWLLSLPLYHIGGLAILVRSLVAGSAVIVPDANNSLEEMLIRPEVTHISLVSTQLIRLMDSVVHLENLKKLKAILLGGGPIPDEIIDRAFEAELPIFTSYGSTEMSSQISTSQPSERIEHLKTAGKLLPYRELMFAPDNEILVRGETLFQGYLKNGRNESLRDAEGWFHSGDMGWRDDEGYLRISGRKDNQFISGGENIQPEEIESAIMKIEGVNQVMVVPIDHPKYGKRPAAFIKIQATRRQDDKIQDARIQENKIQEIRDYLERELPKFKIPDRFIFWPELDEEMKISRKKFRKRAEQILSGRVDR